MSDETQDTAAADLTDELAKKYDPERLLRIVQQRAGRGTPLEHSVRQKYERRFGVDLGHVRVFTGEFAEQFNKQRSAHAVTVGATGMVLMGGSADKSPLTASGEALLGHELAHVAQQARHAGGGLHRKSAEASAMPFAEEHEAEAEAHEQSILQESQGGGASQGAPAPSSAVAERQAADNLKHSLEQIRERVIELLGDSARVREMRIGSSRRA